MKNKIILALGADIKNRFLIAKGKELFPGPDIGDLNDVVNYGLFKRAVRKAVKRTRPDIVTCDLHPGYFSSVFAREMSEDASLVKVQHHHAHIASVMHEYDLPGPVIGVSFDGTGFGVDGNIWGGEFLIVDKKGFKRAAHLKYRMMPGGDKVVLEPWRMVLSILGVSGRSFIRDVPAEEKDLVLAMMEKGINSPLTSSAGRLFDAAAALLGICTRAAYEAEGPINLEKLCDSRIDDKYGFEVSKDGDCYVIDAKGLFLGMAEDMKKNRNKGVIAAKFHNSMSDIVVKMVKRLAKQYGIRDIALSGGVFQNKVLRSRILKGLIGTNYRTFINRTMPVNDLNISVGQYFVSDGGA